MINLTKHVENKKNPPEPKQEKQKSYDKQSKSFFITINNPIEKGYTHDKIIELIKSTFKKNGLLYYAMVDEMGNCYHTHIYVLITKKKRWSAVQKAFVHSHLETAVKGSPQECRAYLLKEGDKHKDKKETQIADSFYEEGELPSYFISPDRLEMLQQIQIQIDQGMKPEAIMMQNIVFRQYENLIRKQFFMKRFNETPLYREVTVVWHIGNSGSGKSYSYIKLSEQYGSDEVFYASDYANSCTALLDNYEAQSILFLDEVKKNSFNFGYLLQLLQGYRTPIHARYTNVYSCWSQVHLTSIFTPQELYEDMVNLSDRSVDSIYQLTRRITKYVYHWKTDDGQYHEYEIDAKDFTSYDDLKRKAEGNDGFETPDTDVPFN